jgi:hypothetical protein
MRHAHVLKVNLKVEIPSQCIFFDTETDEIPITSTEKQLVLKMGTACYVRRTRGYHWSQPEWLRFTKPEEFWDWVSSHCVGKKKLYIFAHNFMFDFTVVQGFPMIASHGFKLEKAIIDDPPVIIMLRRGKETVCCLDTFNFFKSSVAMLGEGIGLPKMDMPLADANTEAWWSYCQRDTEVICKAMLDFFQFVLDNDLGNFQPTIASQAMNAFRHKFMTHKILIHDDEDALKLERESYHGGRTECFFIGHDVGIFYQLDINSQYPFVMHECDYPRWYLWRELNPVLGHLEKWMVNFCVTADCTVRLDEPAIGVLYHNKLVFPTGKVRSSFSTPELIYLMDKRAIEQCHSVNVYEKDKIFAGYVAAMYELRQKYKREHNDSFGLMTKYILNTLYGKFGQSGFVYDTIDHVDSDEVKVWEVWNVQEQHLQKYRQFGGVVQVMKREGEAFNSFPAISAHVTAYARMYLWKLILSAGRNNVLYVDTDSLIVNQAGYDNLAAVIHPTALGMLKVERIIHDLTINTCKDYRFDNIVKTKGIRKNAIQIADNTFVQDRFRKFKGMVREGNLNQLIVTRTTKVLTRNYDKGTVTSSGRVLPLLLDLTNP